jgi:hypothetical protein
MLPPAYAALPARGSLPVGTASYPIPSGAIFMSPNGNNANAGTIAAPVRTLATALSKVPTGGAVVMRAGTYHDSAVASRTVTIQNYPHEAVWLDGSVIVTGWTASGTTWVKAGWTKEFSSMMGGDATLKARFVDSSFPMAADPDEVFVAGAQLKQVGSAQQVTAGTFYIDDAGDRIVIGTDPTGKQVRASDLPQALRLNGDNSIVRGIGIRAYANGYEVKGAVDVRGTGGQVENVTINDVATIGLSLSGAKKLVSQVTVRRAGMLGIGGNLTDNSVIQNSIATDNDSEGFKPEPVSGGMKFTSARTITVRNNETNANGRGTGVWMDVSSLDITMVNNTANDNRKYGLEAEISARGIFANNLTWNNKEAGIILFDAGGFQVFNNEIGGSNWHGLKLAQDQRRQADGKYLEGRDPRYLNQVDPEIPWLTENVVVSNNVFGNRGNFSRGSYQLYGLDGRSNRPMDDWNITIDGNLFNTKTDASQPTMVAWGEGDNVTLQIYESPAALAAAKNPAWVNAQIPGSKRIEDMGPDKIAYQWAARPIPQDVAAATGLPAAAKLLGTRY